ncbi:hypothetical protein [Rhodococcus pyridinivorans]|uniref:hypothetical protein n=1 Tax=Rhodococcus pyridinivorans TaxID=103816 RepID=UPI003BB5359B
MSYVEIQSATRNPPPSGHQLSAWMVSVAASSPSAVTVNGAEKVRWPCVYGGFTACTPSAAASSLVSACAAAIATAPAAGEAMSSGISASRSARSVSHWPTIGISAPAARSPVGTAAT